MSSIVVSNDMNHLKTLKLYFENVFIYHILLFFFYFSERSKKKKIWNKHCEQNLVEKGQNSGIELKKLKCLKKQIINPSSVLQF